MFADLHLHTCFSDSTRTPEQLAECAQKTGLGLIAVCDHDTTGAYGRLRLACDERGLRLIQGVELSCRWRGLTLHLLGLGFNPDHPAMLGVIEHNQSEYTRHDEALIGNLAKDFPRISLADFRAFSYPTEIGGWKNTNYMVARGAAPNIAEALAMFGRYADYKTQFVSLEETCKAVAEAGGVPVLAHPVNWWGSLPDGFEGILQDLTLAGVRGVECFYPAHSDEMTRRCLDFCGANDLRITAGSDDHGEFNRVIGGVEYTIGAVTVDESNLDLRGIV